MFALKSATIGGKSYLDILTWNPDPWTNDGRELAARDMFYLQRPNCFWYRALIACWINIRIISFYLRGDLDKDREVWYHSMTKTSYGWKPFLMIIKGGKRKKNYYKSSSFKIALMIELVLSYKYSKTYFKTFISFLMISH